MATNYPDGGNSSVILGEGGQIDDRADMDQVAYPVQDWNINETSESEEDPSLRASLAPNPPGPARLGFAGSFRISVLLNKLLMIWKALSGDPNPSSVAVPDKTIVASGTALTIDIVDDQDVTSAITVADDLDDVDEAVRLTLSPGTAALTGAGTITINYSIGSITGTLVATYIASNLTDDQYLTLPKGATITSVVGAGLTAGDIDILASRLNSRYFTDETSANDQTIAVVATDTDVTAAITVAETLANYLDEQELTLSPGTTALALGTGVTTATITINYTAADSTTGTLVASYISTTLTADQTLTLPADAYISSIVAAGFGSGDIDITTTVTAKAFRNPGVGKSGRLEFTFSDANADGSIMIIGLRKGGMLDRHVFRHSETIDLRDVTLTTAALSSDKSFHEIRYIEILDSSGNPFTTGTVQINSKPEEYLTSFEFKQTEIERLTAEAELAGIPHKLTNMIISDATLNIAAGGNNLEANVIGERMEELQSIESDIAIEQFTSTREQYPTDFPLVDPDFFPGFGGFLLVDGEALLFRGAAINFALDREVSEAIQGGPFSDDFESTGRAITATLPTYFQSGTLTSDKFIRWQETLRNQEPIKVQIFLFAFSRQGKGFVTEIEFPHALVIAPVDKNVNARGRVPIDVQVGAFPDPDKTDPPDVQIRVTGSDTL